MVERTPESEKYINEVAERSRSDDVATNPFRCRSKVKRYPYNIELIHEIEPIYPNLSRFGGGLIILGVLLMFLIKVVGIILIIGGLLVSLNGIMFLSLPYIVLFKRGLRKTGYKGEIKTLSKKEILSRGLN